MTKLSDLQRVDDGKYVLEDRMVETDGQNAEYPGYTKNWTNNRDIPQRRTEITRLLKIHVRLPMRNIAYLNEEGNITGDQETRKAHLRVIIGTHQNSCTQK